MKYIGTSLIKNKKAFKIIFLLILIGFIMGFLLYKKIDNTSLLNEIKDIKTYLNTYHINFIVLHLIYLMILIIFSFTFLGLILFPLYLIYESITITYNILSFINIYHFNGLIYSLIYNILTKAIFVILVLYLFKNMINFLKNLLLFLKNKTDNKALESIIKHFRNIIFIIIIAFINDLIIYLFLHNILAKLTFILY